VEEVGGPKVVIALVRSNVDARGLDGDFGGHGFGPSRIVVDGPVEVGELAPVFQAISLSRKMSLDRDRSRTNRSLDRVESAKDLSLPGRVMRWVISDVGEGARRLSPRSAGWRGIA